MPCQRPWLLHFLAFAATIARISDFIVSISSIIWANFNKNPHTLFISLFNKFCFFCNHIICLTWDDMKSDCLVKICTLFISGIVSSLTIYKKKGIKFRFHSSVLIYIYCWNFTFEKSFFVSFNNSLLSFIAVSMSVYAFFKRIFSFSWCDCIDKIPSNRLPHAIMMVFIFSKFYRRKNLFFSIWYKKCC